MKRSLFTLLLVAVVALVACGDDNPVGHNPPPPDFPEISQKALVLNNFEQAYNKRRIDKYEQLLDENFTFYLAASDVGGNVPASWDRAVEISANANLLASDPPGDLPRVTGILMDLRWEESLAWFEMVTPSDEKWYRATVVYAFQFEVEPDVAYINGLGSRAMFTVRNAGTDEAPQWRLVEMRDLGSPSSARATSVASAEQATIGKIKVMYLP